MSSKKKKYETVGELIYWSYSNLAMAHSAVERKQKKYNTYNYVIRARLFKGLKDGNMNIRTIFDDEKIKLITGNQCNYCGGRNRLSLDHIFPRNKGGEDNAANLIYACSSCNSSKGSKDLIEWMSTQDKFLPMMVIRRYLKLIFEYCKTNGLLNVMVEDINKSDLPFRLDSLPIKFSDPNILYLSINDRTCEDEI